ncbi:MAG: phosphoribosylformimino-5-aminoimidazole carboxamide ribotide isomerase, partial [Clostridiales bacterium 41_21_two_genomes]
LKDEGNQASTNFTSELDAAWYARQYQKDHLKGGHIILLNPVGSEYYEATKKQAMGALAAYPGGMQIGGTKKQAMGALAAYPGGMQIGGGITADNAQEYLDSGASHVIVTSYVFKDGIFHEERLQKLVAAVGKEHVVLDLSCRRKDGKFYVVTDRWQKFTELALSHEVLNELSKYCDEFLIHGVDVEGKGAGMETELVRMLGSWDGIPITYAGGIGSMEDLERFRKESGGKVDFTIGSALDLFGGKIPYAEVCKTVL